MFDLLVFVLVNAFWASLIICGLLFFLRVFYAFQQPITLKKQLAIMFMPLSIGFYQHATYNRFLKIYEIIVILQFMLMFIGSIFILYLRLELNII
jgi:hypothetical protein